MEQLSLLVVEDNLMLQKMVSLMAKRRGVPVVIVGSCAEAMAAIQSGHNFGMVLMDWSLPDQNGLECTRCIRTICESDVPIVAMTGHAMPGDREACMEAGMNDYLSKPFTFDEFSSTVSKWMGQNLKAPYPMPQETGEQRLPPTA
jgi:CheY-like chemotaxis protein